MSSPKTILTANVPTIMEEIATDLAGTDVSGERVASRWLKTGAALLRQFLQRVNALEVQIDEQAEIIEALRKEIHRDTDETQGS